MNRYRFGDTRLSHGLFERPLNPIFLQMVAPLDAGARVNRQRG